MPNHLENLQEPSLIPLAIRANESKRENACFVGTKALELIQIVPVSGQLLKEQLNLFNLPNHDTLCRLPPHTITIFNTKSSEKFVKVWYL
ncbi:Uncharacterised protein [Streptococcus massiliensis]|uniref:Uncharacterized protein n=1 Tax=Streptococcus massiliensis TaxID=313439 RepID=A0A380KYK9_9STRE|nr:Uncharacterised protein [Streptococcus massiliensis]